VRKKLTQHERATRFAKRIFRLDKFVDAGEAIVISEKLRDHIHGYMTWSWVNGYTAGRAAGRADARKAAK
jgi:hypothetical protein